MTRNTKKWLFMGLGYGAIVLGFILMLAAFQNRWWEQGWQPVEGRWWESIITLVLMISGLVFLYLSEANNDKYKELKGFMSRPMFLTHRISEYVMMIGAGILGFGIAADITWAIWLGAIIAGVCFIIFVVITGIAGVRQEKAKQEKKEELQAQEKSETPTEH